ncbi:MAG: hypothetical protein ACRDZR_18845, partial [Acidimicrobiales bacterium]
MTGPADLDRRLREALGETPGGPPGPAPTRELLAALGRRRARHRFTLAAAAVVVVIAAAGTAYAAWPARGGPTTAAGPPAGSTTAPAARSPGGTGDHGQALGAGQAPAGSLVPPPGPGSCVRVQVEGRPASCAGAYAPGR